MTEKPIGTLSQEEKMMTSMKKFTYSHKKRKIDMRNIFDRETKAADRKW